MREEKETQWLSPSEPPSNDRDVKVLMECDKRPGEQITGYGFYSNANKKWVMLTRVGKCYSVIGWAEQDSNTPNFSTETL